MEKVRIGVIGTGRIAQNRSIPGILLANNAELVAVMDCNAEAAEAVRAKFNAKYAFTDLETMLSCDEIDAVYIATPVQFHAEQSRAAADHGKHILCEKPIAMTAKEAEETVAYCEGKGVKFAAGFMMRYGTNANNMKMAIADGRIGQVVTILTRFTAWSDDKKDAWRHFKAQSGGGSLMDLGVHCIDLMEYVGGSRVKSVMALNDTLTFSYEVEDSSTLLLQLENGAHCVVQSNFNVPDQATRQRFEFLGTKGSLLATDIIAQSDSGTLEANFMEHGKGDLSWAYGNLYQREFESFADSVLNDKPVNVPAADAAHVQRVMEAAYESSATGKKIEL